MTPPLPRTVILLDVEASGLGPDAWPVEVGVAVVEDDAIVVCESRLIRPHPGWSEEGWAEDSAAVHGIPRTALDDAPPAGEVALWPLGLLGGRRAWSDAPMHDRRWLDTLTRAAGHGPGAVRLDDYDRALFGVFGEDTRGQAAIRAAWLHVDRTPVAHRAAADPRLLAEGYLAGRRALEGCA